MGIRSLNVSWWVYVLIWTVQVILIVLFLSPDHIRNEITQEYQDTEWWLGAENTAALYEKSTFAYNHWIVENKVDQFLYDTFLPEDVEDENVGIERLRKETFWDLVLERLEAFLFVTQTMFFRARIFLMTFFLTLPYLIPVTVDGLMKREIVKLSEDNASVSLYSIAKVVLSLLVFLPFFMLFWPWSISPVYLLVWAVCLSFSVWITAANLQHRL